MRIIIAIALNDLMMIVSDRMRLLITVIIVPVGITLVAATVIGAPGGDPQTVLVDVLDADGSAASGAFLSDVRAANARLVLCPMDNTPADICQMGGETELDITLAERRLRDRVSLALIEIPAGFEAGIAAGGPVSIGYRSDEGLAAPGFILQAVRAAVQRLSGATVARQVGRDAADDLAFLTFQDEADRENFAQAIHERAADYWAGNPVTVDFVLTEAPVANASESGFSQSVPGMATMFVMYTVFGSMMAIIQERRDWTLARLSMMPVTRAQIVGGKILAWFLIGLMQFMVIFAVGLLIGVNFGRDPLATVLLMLAYTAWVTALSFAVGSLMRTEQQVVAVSVLLALTLAPLGGAWWSPELMPQWMQVIGHVSPVAWAMNGFRALIFENGSLTTILPSLAVLAAMSALLFGFGVRRFRVL